MKLSDQIQFRYKPRDRNTERDTQDNYRMNIEKRWRRHTDTDETETRLQLEGERETKDSVRGKETLFFDGKAEDYSHDWRVKQNHERDVNQTSTAAGEREREKTRNPGVSQRERRVKRKHTHRLVLHKRNDGKERQRDQEGSGLFPERGEALKRKRENERWKDKRERRSKQIV